MTTDGSLDGLRVLPVSAPIREQVYQNLRQAIVEMRFKPGQRLIERDLVEKTAASRTSVREALRQLAADGLVTKLPNNQLIVTVPMRSEVKELYEIRGLLESLEVKYFTEEASDEEVVELRRRLEVFVSAQTTKELLEAKDKFYELLGRHSPMSYLLLSTLRARVTFFRSLSLGAPGRRSVSIQEMYELMDRIEARDVRGAEEACLLHARRAKEHVLSLIDDGWLESQLKALT